MSKKPFPFSVCKECCATAETLTAKDITYSGDYYDEEQNVEDAINYLGAQNKDTHSLAQFCFQNIGSINNNLNALDSTIQKNEQTSRNTFANALKGFATGESIALNDISPVEHTLGVKISGETIEDISAVRLNVLGKNLLPFPYYDFKEGAGTVEKNGLTISVNDKGAITLNGTCTGTTQITLCRIVTSLPAGIKSGDRITISKNCSDESQQALINFTFNYYDINGKQTGGIAASTTQAKTGTVGEGWVGCYIYLYIAKDTVLNNLTVKPMIELGSTATEYEAYKEPIEYSVNSNGTVTDVVSIYPNMTLTTDTLGATIDCEYSKDINKVIEELTNAIIALGGNV